MATREHKRKSIERSGDRRCRKERVGKGGRDMKTFLICDLRFLIGRVPAHRHKACTHQVRGSSPRLLPLQGERGRTSQVSGALPNAATVTKSSRLTRVVPPGPALSRTRFFLGICGTFNCGVWISECGMPDGKGGGGRKLHPIRMRSAECGFRNGRRKVETRTPKAFGGTCTNYRERAV